MKKHNYQLYLIILIVFGLIIKFFIAAFTELGNDEVYYWTYAVYPDLSHFDHPLMTGLFIQLSTINLLFDSELFIRLSSLLSGLICTILIFKTGAMIKDERSGFFAALLYNASFYSFIIAGTFILPDTPQLLFWLCAMFFFIQAFKTESPGPKEGRKMLFAGLFVGLAVLSKYTSVYLWLGSGLFIALYRRIWFKKPALYISVFISMLLILPIGLWNLQNDFISFTFHSSRIGFFEAGLRPDFFFTELLGQFFYNNPVNFVLIVIALIAIAKGKKFISGDIKKLLLLWALPLIATFLFFSLFRRTLPHWSGPAYISLILIAATHLATIIDKGRLIPLSVKMSLLILLLVLVSGFSQIRYGLIDFSKLGMDDVTADMYGWSQLKEKIEPVFNEDVSSGAMGADAPIIARKWFPAAHLDYYVATPLKRNLLAVNDLHEIHKYAWINAKRPFIQEGGNAYYISTSIHYRHPDDFYKGMFEETLGPDTIPIIRNDKLLKEVYLFRLKGLKGFTGFNKLMISSGK